ncbi:KpsF/GutQ family sugar-phosphate isomerase [Aestuariispira insulae]|uniref:Arabinose-5-phosphate isomerase n=1 Tax=Aestuariispira insulae TaxID=1461337 RepID=A0A3D9H9N3_9PROT|nr:KpsF/GutQ family sugar-phosphate isomerase [Aestuariispira insulae]RED46197.1 arabinose-5-phosphate isomerase [Aestuariispira insulae]
MLNQQIQPSVDDRQAELDVEAGRKVLARESDAIKQLADSLNGEFSRAITLFSTITGRVIVSGMGKSGHIGRKIAASMASTGTPAQYVHPGEASHGDLGMITHDDAILAISNSGETNELRDLLEYAKRSKIPLVAITSRPDSTLASYSDIALILPDEPEAGELRLAPTTSTAMTLALGDALTIALLERKGFTPEKFHNFHPGGKLGRQLQRVSDLMHSIGETPLTSRDTRMQDAIVIMAEKPFGCVGVVDSQGRLQGIVTDGDLRRHMSPDLLDKAVGDIMKSNPITTSPDALAMEVIGMMNEKKIGAIFVTEGDKAVGIAHLHDFLRAGIS